MPISLRVVALCSLTTSIASCTPPPAPAARSAVVDACAAALAPSPVRDDEDRRIEQLRDEARHGVRRAQALEQLGYRYVARARARYDTGDYVLAEQVAACLMATAPEDEAGLLLRGHSLHQMHRFAEAEAVARSLVERRGMPLDYGLLGDVLLERGRVSDAAAAYQTMLDLKPYYQSYVRGAHLRWTIGDLDGAIGLMRLAISAASPRDPDSIAWAYTRLCLYELQRGSADAASRAVDAALLHRRDYAPALLARGRILLALGRAGDAIAVLRRAERLNPLPEYQWVLADALRAAGDDAAAAAVERALEADGRRTDPRTVALFLATRARHPDAAVALARHEMTVRADVFTLDALAWALAAAGRSDAAAPVMDRALAYGTKDARLFLHAAVIAGASGRRGEARRWTARAAALRAMLLPSELQALSTLEASSSSRQENGS